MLSYLHAFHAGNFADVQKHAALLLALRMMQAKPAGIACFDTHAGSALYDLDSERARKTGEADGGIQRVWQGRERLHSEDWQTWLQVLQRYGRDGGRLRQYPGSPEWLRLHLRAQDSLTAFELHPSESERLGQWAGQDKSGQDKSRVRHEDGLQGLLRQLPPPQPRLLVLMDPSYEIKSDYQQVAETLTKAWRKCRHGVYLVWYPILTSGLQSELIAGIDGSPLRKVWCHEILLNHPPERGMVGSGMLVVNPPWGFDDRLAVMMADVCDEDCLAASATQRWLVPE